MFEQVIKKKKQKNSNNQRQHYFISLWKYLNIESAGNRGHVFSTYFRKKHNFQQFCNEYKTKNLAMNQQETRVTCSQHIFEEKTIN